jgi:hypothetical protein
MNPLLMRKFSYILLVTGQIPSLFQFASLIPFSGRSLVLSYIYVLLRFMLFLIRVQNMVFGELVIIMTEDDKFVIPPPRHLIQEHTN